MKYEFDVSSEYVGVRLDIALTELLEKYSRSKIQKLIPLGRVTVNGEVMTSKKYIIQAGDLIAVDLEGGASSGTLGTPNTSEAFGTSSTSDILGIFDTDSAIKEPKAEAIPLVIVYEDENYLVVDKPSGLVVHPANGNESGTLVNALIYYLGDSFKLGMQDICSPERPGIVHRIDKDTSGLLVVAKTKAAYQSLTTQFKEHSITRKYTALVYNSFKEEEGTIDFPIGRDPKNRLRRAVNGLEARPAVTHYRVLKRIGNCNLVEARLETGRTHQIRVHMSYIGHPVVGDPVYGPRKDVLGAGGQMLHAGVLGFRTIEGKYLEFASDLPEHFQAVIAKAERLAK